MHTDLPLKDSSKDKLGRHPFAYEIAYGFVNSFKDNNESIVLGINGTWGSGKSTLLNFIINEVEHLSKDTKQEIIVLRFNPWMFSGQKELQTVFLRELILILNNKSELLKTASKKIAEFLEYLNWVNYIHSGAGELLKSLKNIFKKAGKEKELYGLKSEIDTILIKAKVKLYITIDDIDRLTPSEITEIFQLIKLNGNFANTIFVLAYDQDVVESALVNQFGENGKKYIQKIVQVDYTLPSVSKEDMSRIFIDNLNQLFTDQEIIDKIKDLNETIKDEPFLNYFSSLRDIYRYNNSIKLRLPSIFNELNIVDFLIIESIRLFDHKAYQFIINNKESLVHESKNSIKNLNSQPNNEKLIEQVIIESRLEPLTKTILSRLFLNNHTYTFNANSPENLIRAKKVANANYFNRYFNLQLSNFDIQEVTFDNFINKNSTQENVEILKQINKKGQLIQFLNWVKIKSKNSDNTKLHNIIKSMFFYLNTLSYESGNFWGFGSEFGNVIHFSSILLENILYIESRGEVILEHLESNRNFSSFYIGDRIVNAYEKLEKQNLFSNNEWYYLFAFEQDYDTNFIKRILENRNSIALELFNKILITSDYLTEDEISLVLNVVHKNYENHYKANFSKLIEEDTELLKYLWLSIKLCWKKIGNRVGYQLADFQFFPGLNKEDIKNRIDKFNPDRFDENQNKIIALFQKAYLDGFKEKKYYDLETLEDMDS